MMTIMKLIISIFILGTIYFVIDRHLFYYGKNDLAIYNRLPLGIKPEFRYDFEGGFCMNDAFNERFIGKGFKYRSNDTVVINEIIEYGFSQDKLIAKTIDKKGNLFFVECSENLDKNAEMRITVIDPKYKIEIWKYKWINLGENKLIISIELVRNYLMFIILGLTIILLVKIARRNKQLPTTPPTPIQIFKTLK